MVYLKKIALAIALALGLFVVVGLFLPRVAHVERSAVVNAPPSVVFTVLNGFRRFPEWSPWAELDPQAVNEISGPALGVGAKLAWRGNDEVGSGTQEIVGSTPYSRVRIKLTFGDFPGGFLSTYDLEPQAGGTRVTWSFDADYGGSLVGRWFGLFADGMVGPDYERGLARLQAFAETLPKSDFAGLHVELTDTHAQPVLLVATRSADNPSAMGVALGVAYSRLSGFMHTHGLRQLGPPLTILHGEAQNTLSFDAAIPVDRTEVPASRAIRTGRLRAGPALRAVHRGPYAGLRATHGQVRAYLAAAGLEQDGPAWEQYVSDPGTTPEAQLITHVYYPIK